MLEDFREQASSSSFFEEEEIEEGEPGEARKVRQKRGPFLGMTAAQRLVIALMLLMLTCLLSTFCLLATQKVVPPFLY